MSCLTVKTFTNAVHVLHLTNCEYWTFLFQLAVGGVCWSHKYSRDRKDVEDQMCKCLAWVLNELRVMVTPALFHVLVREVRRTVPAQRREGRVN